MTVWDDLVGQEAAVRQLRAAVAAVPAAMRGEPAPEMSHAWLFTGPPGSGRSVAARAFAASLQCLEPVAADPGGVVDSGCGHCAGCRTSLAGTHADVEVVDVRTLSIGVDDARALVASAARRPSGGRWQIIVIEDVDRLTERAADALLKSVEEPAERTVWLLCAPSLEDAPPTVRSRCRHLGLRTPPTAAVAEVLVRRDGVDEAMAQFAARAAQGHIGRARRLATDEPARLRRHVVLRMPLSLTTVPAAFGAAAAFVEAAVTEAEETTAVHDADETEQLKRSLGVMQGSRQPPGAATALKSLGDEQRRRATRSRRDAVDRALVDLASFYRDVLVLQTGAEVGLVNDEIREAVTAVARQSSAEQTVRRIDSVLLARQRVDAAMPPLLAVEAMAVSLTTSR